MLGTEFPNLAPEALAKGFAYFAINGGAVQEVTLLLGLVGLPDASIAATCGGAGTIRCVAIRGAIGVGGLLAQHSVLQGEEEKGQHSKIVYAL